MSEAAAPHGRDAEGQVARYRFFVTEPPESGALSLHGELAHRLTRVLRLTAGARVQLFDGSGRAWDAEIAAIQRQAVHLSAAPASVGRTEPVTTLLVGLMRPNRFEWLVEKATELGVTTIQPVISRRSAVRPAEIGAARLERWRRIAVEAAEQCGRLTVPALYPPVPIADALRGASGRLYIAAEPAHGATRPLGSALAEPAEQPLSLLTGPEGGLTAEEVSAAVAGGGLPVSLGRLILRAETAALAALAIVADARAAADHADTGGTPFT